jgi:hypothetical protein
MSNATTYSEGNWGMNAIETGIIQGDCVEEMAKMEAGSVDLAFADPPFNIGYEYDVYEDEKGYEEYLDWTAKWVHQVDRLLKPNGTFWLAIGDAFASDLDVLCRRQFGFTRRSWVIWRYTFGVNSVKKFTPSHTHLFHYVKDPKQFTFNGDSRQGPLGPSAGLRGQAGQGRRAPARTTSGSSAPRPSRPPLTRNPTPGSSRGSAAPTRRGSAGTPVRCRWPSWTGLSRYRATRATWSSTRSPAAAPPWRPPGAWGGKPLALNCPKTTSREF